MNKVDDDDIVWSDDEDDEDEKPDKSIDSIPTKPVLATDAPTGKAKDEQPVKDENDTDGGKSEEAATESTGSFEVVSMPPESRKPSSEKDPSPKSEKSDGWGEDWE
jgi:hypothetical protein